MKPSGQPVTVIKWQQGRLARTAAVAIAFVAILLATACGGSDSSAAPPQSTASVDEPAPTTTVTVVDDEAEDTSDPAGPVESDERDGEESIELAYSEGFLAEGFTVSPQAREDCDDSDPDTIVCTWELSGSMVGTLIGRASENQTGTSTLHLDRPCELDGQPGHMKIDEGDGIITTARGDELNVRYWAISCSLDTGTAPDERRPSFGWLNVVGTWTADGGTGRFEGASGLMSTVAPVLQSGFIGISSGTLTVRADLWEEILPQ